MLGGEQFGTFLEVIRNKAGETFDECVNFGRGKNKELDAAASTNGRWFFHKLNHTYDLDSVVCERLDNFYESSCATPSARDLCICTCQ